MPLLTSEQLFAGLFLVFCLPSGLQQVKHIIELRSCAQHGMFCLALTNPWLLCLYVKYHYPAALC